MRESVRIGQCPHGNVMRSPFADSLTLAKSTDKRLERCIRANIEFTCDYPASDICNCRYARSHNSQPLQIGDRDGLSFWEKVVDAFLVAVIRLSVSHRHARHERRRCLHRHLLPENRAKGDFETTPAAWHAGPWVTRNQLGKSRVKSKCAVDYLTVCTQVEYRANSLNHPLKRRLVVNPYTE